MATPAAAASATTMCSSCCGEVDPAAPSPSGTGSRRPGRGSGSGTPRKELIGRMGRREAVGLRVTRDLVQAQWFGSSMRSPSRPCPVGRAPISPTWTGLMPWCTKVRSRLSRSRVQDSERGVVGAGELPGDLDDPGKHAVQAEVSGHRHDGVEQQPQPACSSRAPLTRFRTSRSRSSKSAAAMPPDLDQACVSFPAYGPDGQSFGCLMEKIAAWVLLSRPSLASIEET